MKGLILLLLYPKIKYRMNILLIDDDEASNVYTEIILRRSGKLSSIEICKNGEDGFFYLKSNLGADLDLILLDINMPIMNGHEFLGKYCKSIKNKIPIVMLSTSILKEDKDDALKFKCVKGFINKPISIEKIKKYLG